MSFKACTPKFIELSVGLGKGIKPGHCCPKYHIAGRTARRPAAAVPKEREYSALLAWRIGKV